MKTGIDPKVDYAFKRVFGSEENRNVLRHLLNAVLHDSLSQPIADVTILNPFSLKDALDDKLSIVDVRARDETGREYLIEVQLFPHANFLERLLYYGAKQYAGQLSEGEDYSHLRPVIVVCFVDACLLSDARDYHSHFELFDPHQQVRFCDGLSIHLIELPKFARGVDELRDNLDRWTYFLRHGEELDPNVLPEPLAVLEIEQATGTLTMLSRNDQEQELYEARLKADRDAKARISYAQAEGERRGLAEGVRRGREEGVRQGEVEGRVALILQIGAKRLGPPPAEVVAELKATTNLERLTELADRILDCPTWEALLAIPKP